MLFVFYFGAARSRRSWASTASAFLFSVELLWILGKDSEVVSCCLLHGLKFRVFLFLEWMLREARETSLLGYLTHSWREKWWSMLFAQRVFARKWMQQTRVESDILFRSYIRYTICTCFFFFFLVMERRKKTKIWVDFMNLHNYIRCPDI